MVRASNRSQSSTSTVPTSPTSAPRPAAAVDSLVRTEPTALSDSEQVVRVLQQRVHTLGRSCDEARDSIKACRAAYETYQGRAKEAVSGALTRSLRTYESLWSEMSASVDALEQISDADFMGRMREFQEVVAGKTPNETATAEALDQEVQALLREFSAEAARELQIELDKQPAVG